MPVFSHIIVTPAKAGAQGRAPCRSPWIPACAGTTDNPRESPDVRIHLSQAHEPRRDREFARCQRGGKARRRRHDLGPDPEAAAGEAVRPGRPRRDPVLARHHRRRRRDRDRRDDPARRSAQFAGRQTGHSRVGGDGRADRRPGGAQPRHDRRLDLEQRPGGGLSGGTRGARRHRAHDQARDRRPRPFSPACSRRHSSRTRS